jgi:hypothetical protein
MLTEEAKKDLALRFFNAVYQNAKSDELITVFDLPTTTNMWVGDLDDLNRDPEKFFASFWNIPQRYFPVSTRRKPGEGIREIAVGNKVRGGYEECHTLHVLFADIDCAHPSRSQGGALYPPVEVVSRAFDELPMPTSIEVESGRGLFPLHLLHEGLEVKGEVEAREAGRVHTAPWIDLIRRTIQRVGKQKFDVDPVWDISRMLRCPFSLNEKTGEQVSIRKLEEGLRYHLDDLAQYTAGFVPPAPDYKAMRSLDGRYRDQCLVVPRAVKLLLCNSPEFWDVWNREVAKKSDSDYVWYIACTMANQGQGYDAIYDALSFWMSVKGEKKTQKDICNKAHRSTVKAMSSQQAVARREHDAAVAREMKIYVRDEIRAIKEAEEAALERNEPVEEIWSDDVTDAEAEAVLAAIDQSLDRGVVDAYQSNGEPEIGIRPDSAGVDHRHNFQQITGMDLGRVLKRGNDHGGHYTIEVSNHEVVLGSLKDWMHNPKVFNSACCDALSGVSVQIGPKVWPLVFTAIKGCEEWAPTDAYSIDGKVLEILGHYLREHEPQPKAELAIEAVEARTPWLDGGRIRVHPSALAAFASTHYRHAGVTADMLRTQIARMGWGPQATTQQYVNGDTEAELARKSFYCVPTNWRQATNGHGATHG